MQLRKSGTEQPDINLTSLIDVVFLLLIFFMITTTFLHSTAMKVILPEASNAEQEQQPSTVMLTISADGQFAIDDSMLGAADVETVRSALASRWAEKPDMTLIINADAETAHKNVITAMDAAAAVGITSLSIATERSTAETAEAAEAADSIDDQ